VDGTRTLLAALVINLHPLSTLTGSPIQAILAAIAALSGQDRVPGNFDAAAIAPHRPVIPIHGRLWTTGTEQPA
jgi:hypothetical protein